MHLGNGLRLHLARLNVARVDFHLRRAFQRGQLLTLDTVIGKPARLHQAFHLNGIALGQAAAKRQCDAGHLFSHQRHALVRRQIGQPMHVIAPLQLQLLHRCRITCQIGLPFQRFAQRTRTLVDHVGLLQRLPVLCLLAILRAHFAQLAGELALDARAGLPFGDLGRHGIEHTGNALGVIVQIQVGIGLDRMKLLGHLLAQLGHLQLPLRQVRLIAVAQIDFLALHGRLNHVVASLGQLTGNAGAKRLRRGVHRQIGRCLGSRLRRYRHISHQLLITYGGLVTSYRP